MHFVRSERATLTWFFLLFRKQTAISLTQGLQYTLTLLTSHFSIKKKNLYDFPFKNSFNSFFIFLTPVKLTNIFAVIFFVFGFCGYRKLLRSLFILLCELSPQDPFPRHEWRGQQSLWGKHPTAECQWYLLTGCTKTDYIFISSCFNDWKFQNKT